MTPVGVAAAKVKESVSTSKCEDVRRDAFKRVRQRIPVVNFDALSPEQIEKEVDTLFSEAIEVFASGGG